MHVEPRLDQGYRAPHQRQARLLVRPRRALLVVDVRLVGLDFPGTYNVSVAGANYSNLPTQPFLANGALTVGANLSGQALDVKTVSVGGSLTLNGAAPSTTTACNPSPTATKANVQFFDATSGYQFEVPVACSAADFSWTGAIYPGTYRIAVAGASGYSNLPSEGFLVTPRLQVQ